MITAAVLKAISPECQEPINWATVLEIAAKNFGIDNPSEAAEWLAQLAHESAGFNRLIENLNYSASGLMRTWPKRFPNEAAALPYARQPEKIANFVYANRMGNGPVESGDGWRFRGRGLIQLTGRNGYAKAGLGIGVPLVEFPELAVDKLNAAKIAGWYWRMKNLDAVIGDVRADTIAVNGGTTGLAEREILYQKAKEALHV